MQNDAAALSTFNIQHSPFNIHAPVVARSTFYVLRSAFCVQGFLSPFTIHRSPFNIHAPVVPLSTFYILRSAFCVQGFPAVTPPESKYQWGTMPEMFGPRHEHRVGMMLRETGKLPRGTRILEAAIGLGQLAERLRAQAHRVVGIDNSIEAARYVRNNLDVPVVIADMAAMPFRSGSFVAVTSGETLEHLPDDAGAVKEFERVLAPGGSCVVTVPALESLRTFSDEYYQHLRRYSREQLSSLFERVGLRVERATFWGFPLVLAYDTFFILPMNRRRAKQASHDATLPSVVKVGRAKWLVNLVRALFATDRLFGFVPIGVGLMLVARKTPPLPGNAGDLPARP